MPETVRSLSLWKALFTKHERICPLGKHILYMDAGSGAKCPITETMIQKVSAQILSTSFLILGDVNFMPTAER